MSTYKSQILSVGVVGINERTLNMLELYFSRQCRGRYVLTGLNSAQVTIVDLDAVGGRKMLEEQMAAHPHRPVVAFTVRDTEIDGVQLLRKPIQLDELGKALDFFHSEIDHTPVINDSYFKIPEPEPEPEPERQAEIEAEIGPPPEERATGSAAEMQRAAEIDPEVRAVAYTQQLAHNCCGSNEDVELTNPEARKGVFYHPENYLQGSFEKAMRLSNSSGKAVELRMRRAKTLLFLPQSGCVISDISDRLLRALCVQPMKSGSDFVVTQLSEGEEWLIGNTKGERFDIDPLHWKVALWSSRGRVPAGTNLEGVVHLSNWPNFTRLMVIPEFMRMAAFWSQGEHSLRVTNETLGVAQRYVFSFYSACRTLNFASVEARKQLGGRVESRAQKRPEITEQRSMFGKILTHLRGGK